MQTIKIQYTEKEITPWGGMILFRNLLDQMRFNEVIENGQALPQSQSNRGYHVQTIIEAFMVSIWCGANRFMHTEITRHDNPISKIFRWWQAPGQDVYKRFFSKFNQG